MKIFKRMVGAAVCAALAVSLSGCVMTVDQMYVPPRRSESYQNLQAVMDEVMEGLEYCAPITGENQQTVQMADLDGDGMKEVVVFVKGNDENPLKVLVFRMEDGEYVPLTVIESTGTAYDQVEYIQMDGRPGLELVVGRQVSEQVMRNLTVYRFSGGQPEQLLTVNYHKYLALDMNKDGLGDLFVLRPGRTDTDCGVVELYAAPDGSIARSAEVSLSQPVGQLKRIMTGSLHGGERAVFAASTVDAETIVTDVYALVDGTLTNVSMSNESGTSVKTVRNYYVYAEDIDGDSILELPSLISMRWPMEGRSLEEREHLIRWYALGADGSEHDKRFTYHNYLQGWYMEVDGDLVGRLCVMPEDTGRFAFCLWDRNFEQLSRLWTVHVLTGEDRSSVAVEDGRFVLLKTDNVVYAARLEDGALEAGVTQDKLINSFFLIQSDWKTGEM
ncbi:MAG: hypothetical protein J6I89_07595 [Oscillospiraceae bacterium]|nr:hypothetical protein [Oscillospiraceae bacterium]